MKTTDTPIQVVSLIRKKRDGEVLLPEEIHSLISSYTQEGVPDYQMAAFLMAVFWRGLSDEELLALTEAMLRSGQVVDLSSIDGAKIDKHSTGGVGDKISLPLAPAVAACGVYVPMISGRGLGHTGGTLDKLDAIPGFQSTISIEQFKETLKSTHMGLIGQTKELAPADKKLYALRDVTGTVESIPLIVASILSKKLAEGIDGLVLDVKVGSGALMKTLPDARRLAQTLLSVGRGAGKKVSAFITNMDQPLGFWVGNAAEINESVEVLRGGGSEDLQQLTWILGGEMLRLAGVVPDLETGKQRIAEVLQNGKALRSFLACLAAQGSSIQTDEALRAWTQTNLHPVSGQVLARQSGFVDKIDAEKVGLAGILMEMGRAKKEDGIDPAAYIRFFKKTGAAVKQGEPLCEFGISPSLAKEKRGAARSLLESAFSFSLVCPESQPLVLETYI